MNICRTATIGGTMRAALYGAGAEQFQRNSISIICSALFSGEHSTSPGVMLFILLRYMRQYAALQQGNQHLPISEALWFDSGGNV